MDFGRVLTRAWEITWKHKVLWIFGVLASCTAGGSNSGYRFNWRSSANPSDVFFPQLDRIGRDIEHFMDERGAILIVGLVCLVIILAILFWAISTFGKVGLIQGAVNAETGRPVTWNLLSQESWGLLGQALGLNFILWLLPFLLISAFVLFLLFFGLVTLGFGLLCLIPLVCLLIPAAAAFGVYAQLANVSLVVDRQGIGEALARAWNTLRDNLGPLAGMAVILFFGGLLVGVVLVLPFIAGATPALFSLGANTADVFNRNLIVSAALLLCVALPIYMVLSSVVQTFLNGAWTLTYLELNSGGPASKAVVSPAAPKAPAKKAALAKKAAPVKKTSSGTSKPKSTK